MIENMKGDARSDDTKRTERGRNERQSEISNVQSQISNLKSQMFNLKSQLSTFNFQPSTFNLSFQTMTSDVNHARRIAHHFNPHVPCRSGQRIIRDSRRPFDDDDVAFIAQEFFEVNGVRGGESIIEAIQVEMINRQTSGVSVDECEGGTCDFARVIAERGGDAFDKHGFPRAERAVEKQDFAAREVRAESLAELKSFMFGVRAPLTRECGKRRGTRRVIILNRVAQGISPSGSSVRNA